MKKFLPLTLATALALALLSGCAYLRTIKVPAVPKIAVSSAQYTGQIRPLIVIAESAFAARLTPSQVVLINSALLELDRQAATSSTLDVMPVLVSVAAAEIGDQLASRITLTPAEQAGAQLGLSLLAQQSGSDPTVKALLPILTNALSSAAVAAPAPAAKVAAAATTGTLRIGL